MSSNATPTTAIDITSLPYDITINPSGNADSLFIPSCEATAIKVPLWWKYTPPLGITAVGIRWNTSDSNLNYDPLLTVWTGTPPTLTQVEGQCFDSGASVAFTQINVTPGTTYYFQITHFPGGVYEGPSCIFEVVPPTNLGYPQDSLFVSNDTTNFPAVVISPISGAILKVLGFPAFECADVLPNGIMAVCAEEAVSDEVVSINVYNSQLVLIATNITIPIASQSAISPLRGSTSNTFYIACVKLGGLTDTVIKTMDIAGNELAPTWTLPSNSRSLTAMDVSPDETILYYGGGQALGAMPIHRYDLVNDIALSDLVAAGGGNSGIGRDMITLADGSLLVVWYTNVLSNTGCEIRRYSNAGILLNTYTIGTSIGSSPRIAVTADGLYFWCMSFPTGIGGDNRYQKFNISTGAVVTTLNVQQKVATDSGVNQFGPSQCCPLLLLSVVNAPLSGIYYLLTPTDVNAAQRRHDTLYTAYDPVDTENVQIPDPFVESAYIGDE